MNANRMFLTPVLAMAVLVALPAGAQVKDYRQIKYPPLPEFKIEKPETFTLPNGMRVFLMEDHELPLISVSARIRTGSIYEPAEKVGLADLMATVQRTGGTRRMTGDEIDDYLAARAAFVETSMGDTAGFASMNCLVDDFDDVFRVFAEVLREPVFDEEKLTIAKKQAYANIARRNDNINAITSREFTRLIYGPDSPLGRMEEYATIDAVTRDDLVAWHARFYHPNNVFLGIVGDFDPKAMKEKIQEIFGDWPKGEAFEIHPVDYRKEPNPGVFFIEKTDVTQANISMGHTGILINDPDYFSVVVMNEVLGGGFAGRLFSNVRSKKGLAYSVFGGVGAGFVHPGIFRAGLQTKSSTMGEAVEALREEIVGMLKNPPTDEELQRAKESILNSFVFNYDSKSEILSQQMTYAYYGLPSDFLEQYRANVEKVTKDQVAAAARKYIHPEWLTLLVVGNPKDFDRPVETFGPVTEIDISIPPPPSKTEKVARTPEAVAEGRALLQKAAAKILGGKNLEAVRFSSSMKLSMQGQSMSMNRTDTVAYPDRVRQEIQSPMGTQTTLLDGNQGFVIRGTQSAAIPESRMAEIRKNLERDLFLVLRSAAQGSLNAAAGDADSVNEKSCRRVEVQLTEQTVELCVADDGLVLRERFAGRHPLTQAPGEVELTYDDYREVDGVLFPFRQVLSVDGEAVMELNVSSLDINPELEEDTFRPAS